MCTTSLTARQQQQMNGFVPGLQKRRPHLHVPKQARHRVTGVGPTCGMAVTHSFTCFAELSRCSVGGWSCSKVGYVVRNVL